jgi:hypothetical protein
MKKIKNFTTADKSNVQKEIDYLASLLATNKLKLNALFNDSLNSDIANIAEILHNKFCYANHINNTCTWDNESWSSPSQSRLKWYDIALFIVSQIKPFMNNFPKSQEGIVMRKQNQKFLPNIKLNKKYDKR